MRVEVVSIGDELLLNDILDTNSAHATHCLQDANINIICKVTVGDDPSLIAEVLHVALNRADVVLTTGGLGTHDDDFTCSALSLVTGRELTTTPPRLKGASRLGRSDPNLPYGLLLEEPNGTLICLPGSHREMAYLFETAVLPYLKSRLDTDESTHWKLLRTAGMMESTLRQQIAAVGLKPNQRLTFLSYAGQTDIRVWGEGQSPAGVQADLTDTIKAIYDQLGDHIYGEGETQLEELLISQLAYHNLTLTIAECNTNQSLYHTLRNKSKSTNVIRFIPVSTCEGLSSYLDLETPTLMGDLTRWCRQVAVGVHEMIGSNLSLVVYNHVTQSGVQLLITLASPTGLSAMQRSFGGHPGNIGHWASTLALVQVRRWLLAHRSLPDTTKIGLLT